MRKDFYEHPELEVYKLQTVDIVASSNPSSSATFQPEEYELPIIYVTP